jgi:hypothetical protein
MPTMSARDFLSQLNEDVSEKSVAKTEKRSTMYTILDDLPVPERTRKSKYPFAEMEVGQAFVIPSDAVPAKGLASVRASITGYKKRSVGPSKLIARMLDDGSIGVWKVA